MEFIFGGKEETKSFQNDRVSRRDFISHLVMHCAADEVLHRDAEVVRVVGAIHGGLFLLYAGLLATLHFRQRWFVIFSLYAFVASIIPFGTFVLKKQLRVKEAVAN